MRNTGHVAIKTPVYYTILYIGHAAICECEVKCLAWGLGEFRAMLCLL